MGEETSGTLEARPQQQLLFVRVVGWTINSAALGMMLLENGEIHKGPQTRMTGRTSP